MQVLLIAEVVKYKTIEFLIDKCQLNPNFIGLILHVI